MEQIIFFGDKDDIQIVRLLERYLKQNFSVCHFTESRLTAEGAGEPVQIIDTDTLQEIDLPSAILILKKKAHADRLKAVSPGISVIVDAADANSIALLGENHPSLQVYTCGFGSKNTLTFSSRDAEQTVVSLQRPLVLANGQICEPFEVPCEIEGELEDYSILAAAMTLILIGQLNENKSKEFGKICFSY